MRLQTAALRLGVFIDERKPLHDRGAVQDVERDPLRLASRFPPVHGRRFPKNQAFTRNRRDLRCQRICECHSEAAQHCSFYRPCAVAAVLLPKAIPVIYAGRHNTAQNHHAGQRTAD